MRDRLIELLEKAESAVYWDSSDQSFVNKIADFLMVNGVTIADGNNVGDKKQAKWRNIRLSVPKGRGQTRMAWRCSNCHAHKKVRSPFCPECGFPMEMEGE